MLIEEEEEEEIVAVVEVFDFVDEVEIDFADEQVEKMKNDMLEFVSSL